MADEKAITSMNEDTLVKQVLVPLFEAMGFRDVTIWHGGSEERGKDLVMWQPEGFRDRVNYAVVVKAQRITGKAKGAGSVQECLHQIRQCFAFPYRDQVTGSSQKIQRCLLVSSKGINKEALANLGEMLSQDRRDADVDLIAGKKLWTLIDEYLPTHVLLEALAKTQRSLAAQGAGLEILTRTTRESCRLHIRRAPNDGARADAPLFALQLNFPDTDEGRRRRTEYERLLRTGEPATIPGEFVQSLESPQFLEGLLPPGGMEKMNLHLGCSPHTKQALTRFRMESFTGQIADLDYVSLAVRQVGTEQMTLGTVDDDACEFEVVLPRGGGDARFTFGVNLPGANVTRARDVLLFQRALAAGGNLRIRSSQSGLSLVIGLIEPGLCPSPEPAMIGLLGQLCDVQRTANTPITLPDRAITREEARIIYETAAKMRMGLVRLGRAPASIVVDRQVAEGLLREMPPRAAVPVEMTGEESVNILGTLVEIGTVVYRCSKVRIPGESRRKLRELVASTDEAAAARIELVPTKASQFEIVCPKFLKPRQ